MPGDLASTETARTVAVSSTVSFGSATPDACAEGGLEGVLPVPVPVPVPELGVAA